MKSATGSSFGLMRSGSTLLALRIDMLREVIACPAVLDALPQGAPGLCGAVRLRGCIIPVLEVRALLGEPATRVAAAPTDGQVPVIVVLRCEGRLLGLRVDTVLGMADVAAENLQTFSCVQPSGSDVVTHTFSIDGGIALVLDAQRIMSLPGVPTVVERGIPVRRVGAEPLEPMLLFMCGQLPLGIAASCVEATVPRSKLRDSSLVSRYCRGVVDHHGHEVPVIDTLRFLHLGEAADGGESALVVLRFEQGLLALMLEEVRDIISVEASEIMPLTPIGLQVPHLFRGMLGPAPDAAARESHLLLDHEALRKEEALATFAGLSRPKAEGVDAATAPGAAAAGGANRAYLTYLAVVETASPLIQVAEIIDYPQSGVVHLPEQGQSTIGIFSHRGAAVPLVCLGSLLGRQMALELKTARVLVFESDGCRIGFVVQAICSIETASWEMPAHAESGPGRQRQGLQPLVEIGEGELRRTLPRLDLLQLARAQMGSVAVPVAAATPLASAQAPPAIGGRSAALPETALADR